MKKAFHQFFRPPKTALDELWQSGLFVFDASVLLNIYGYSSKTRDELVAFVEKNSPRVRLPHQFGLEYARNRPKIIVKQVRNYQKVEDQLRKIKDADLAPKKDHPYLSKKSTKAYDAILSELESSRKAMEKLVSLDPYLEKLSYVFEGKVSKCPTPEERAQMEQEAQERYDKSQPPGFADLDKGVPDAYGDCIAWKQILSIAMEEKRGVILVIDDLKEDWWLVEHSRTIGPRPELVEEFVRVTKQTFYMYTSESFLRSLKEFSLSEVGDEVIEEVSERLASQLESRREGETLKSEAGGSPGGEAERYSVTPATKVAELKATPTEDLKLDPTQT